MYTVVEIDKTSAFTGTFTPYTPFVYSSVVSGVVASYWTDTFGADGTYPTTITNITSVVLASIYDVQAVDSIAGCVSQENSFYFDYDTQILYIHYPHDWTPDSVIELTGVAYGFTSDTVRCFRNQLYRPLIKSIPSLSDQADPLQYGIMSFGGGTVSLVNDNGLFDVDEKLYGNILRIKMGDEGDTYDDLILMFTGYIRDYTLTTSEFNVEVADKRERLQVETPSQEFTVLDAYDTTDGWETRSELLPDGYGDVIQVPAYLVDDDVDITELQFDGVDDYVDPNLTIPSSVYGGAFTLYCECKIKPTATPTSVIIGNRFQSEPEYNFVKITPTQVEYAAENVLLKTADFGLIHDIWESIGVTFDGIDLKVYKNGSLFSSDTVTQKMLIDVPFFIGADAFGDVDETVDGSIKNVLIYSRSLAAPEMQDLYEGIPVASNLIHEWLLQEGTGTTATDSAGTNDGTIYGASWLVQEGVLFRWGTEVTSIAQCYTYNEGILKKVSHTGFSSDGTFALSETDVARDGIDITQGAKAVYVTGRMRDYSNPGDIIADLNSRVNGIAYNDSNYNTTEWEAEKAYLDDVYLYMDEAKKVYEWIELIQNGCNWGFRYEDLERITLRRDDPSRIISATINAIDIRNSDMPVLRNAELYASSCKVKYAKNHRTGRYQYTENTDYKSDVINEHHIEKVQQYESILTSQTDAEEKALRVMQDISVVRPIITLRVDAKTYPTPRIYDMVSATVSLLTQGNIIPSLWTYLLGDTIGVLGDANGVIGEVYDETFTEAYSYDDNVREYFGTLTGQVIGIQWLPDSNEIELRLRSR